MKIKTISELNDQTWYRGLKVFYILLLALFLFVTNYLIIDGGLIGINTEESFLNCNQGIGNTKVVLTNLFTIKYELAPSDFKNGSFLYEKYLDGNHISFVKEAVSACSSLDRNPNSTSTGISLEDLKALGAVPVDMNYRFSKITITPIFDYSGLYYLILGNIIVLVVFEVIKRTFYYIKLGSILPKK